MTRGPLTVGALKRLLAEADDAAPVLVPGMDHSYLSPQAVWTTALACRRRGRTDYYEDHGDEHREDDEQRIRAVVLR